jgi:hypothetical protein
MSKHTVIGLAGWLGRAQVMPRGYSNPPPHVLDQLMIAPLLCHLDDDLQGIGAVMDSPNFNPEPPTYALR